MGLRRKKRDLKSDWALGERREGLPLLIADHWKRRLRGILLKKRFTVIGLWAFEIKGGTQGLRLDLPNPPVNLI